ncbi:helix-turn-helix domain-containing protein [Streptococcus suis]|uniref:helix-turn-helix domain-containing protein n=1 Tax=Streptococcus suis TaxID=1307 RepID=UPI000CF6A34F|nr:helix-turn-helix transcriptional regulator [Streptococcus suis]MBS8056103.1 helix-turn-helix transcriptional regulator [Streptococcus suis]HEM3480756.1 helix-turn-helix transcriptional regulator [Streptococcus suis]
MFITFDRIKELAQKRGLSINSLEEKLGYSRNTIYAIKRNQPGSEKLQQIADYFDVSTDYLLGRTDNPRIASDETAIIDGQVVDLREAAAHTMLFDGKPLDDDDIDFITAVLSAHFKNKQKD